MKLIVLRAGDVAAPVAVRRGEFFSWIKREGEGAWNGAWLEHDLRDADHALPDPSAASGFVITGSSSSVTERAPWMLRAEEMIRRLHELRVPLFGICFGHQLIGEALGGKVTKNPNGREIGSVEVKTLPGVTDPVLTGLPATFIANATHVDSVTTLPPGATALASTTLEPNAIFAASETTKCVQFHPEIDGDAMRDYLDARAHLVNAEGLDADAIRARVTHAPHGAETLRNFLRHVVAKR